MHAFAPKNVLVNRYHIYVAVMVRLGYVRLG